MFIGGFSKMVPLVEEVEALEYQEPLSRLSFQNTLMVQVLSSMATALLSWREPSFPREREGWGGLLPPGGLLGLPPQKIRSFSLRDAEAGNSGKELKKTILGPWTLPPQR
jgi:hypothetical protein